MTKRSTNLPKVIVGTAQFGLKYGLANVGGQLSQEKAHGILTLAAESGIYRVDTAQAYGSSESVIGAFKKEEFEVLTKIGRFPDSEPDWADWLSNRISASSAEISLHNLTTVFFHDTAQFLNESREKTLRTLEIVLERHPEIVFGAALYDPAEWEGLKSAKNLNAFQVPHNVLDRRFENSGVIQEMFQMGKTIHLRSVFLQGLLLMDPDALPGYFAPWAPLLRKWASHCFERGISTLAASAGFALRNPCVSGVVIGFDSAQQLGELIEELRSIGTDALDYPDFEELSINLIDPRRWRSV